MVASVRLGACLLASIAVVAPLPPAADDCNMTYVYNEDPPFYAFDCDPNLQCDTGRCHMVTLVLGSIVVGHCYCGTVEANAECEGWYQSHAGFVTFECSPNGCSNCVSDSSPGFVCRCP